MGRPGHFLGRSRPSASLRSRSFEYPQRQQTAGRLPAIGRTLAQSNPT
ncbi:hypothetical protein BSU04_21135 [Caballeronia sordidicola]|uniref:Uncharacterized protein n=1 Tax=Caballeronia sordidicola TaxID=196367 RepID=A0A226WZB0_CABSO|nr:hypothetical protein BSU04_21135 [Caballeronia sordidicola]